MTLGDVTGTGATHFRNDDFSRSVNALFDTRDLAEKARQDLITAGVHGDDIFVVGASDLADATDEPLPEPRAEGFWATLKELFLPDEDRHIYAEGVRRGGYTVSVRTDTANYDRVIDVLDRDGAVDMDERQESWRNDGWSGYTGRDPLAQARSPSLSVVGDERDVSYAPPSAATAGFGASEADRMPTGEAEAPPVESPGALPISAISGEPESPPPAGVGIVGAGMRDLSHGRSRVRSYLRSTDETSGGHSET